jgi:hypothetical protein
VDVKALTFTVIILMTRHFTLQQQIVPSNELQSHATIE